MMSLMARYVIDAPTLLHLVDSDLRIDPGVQLVAPNAIRSQALQLLFRAVRQGDRVEKDAMESHERGMSGSPVRPGGSGEPS